MYVCVSSWSLWGAGQMSACGKLRASWRKFLYIGLHVKPRLHAWHSHRQSRTHFAFSSLSNQWEIRLFLRFSKLFFIQNYHFLYHGDQKISWWTSCRWRAVNFEIHLWSSGMNADCIWRSISIQHVQIEAGLNSDPGNDSFGVEIHDAKHVDRDTVRICYSVGLWFSKVYHYNRCIITSDAHSLRSDPELLFTARDYPWKIDKKAFSMGCRVVFEHFSF